jgi:hypothetical protein
MIPPKVNHLPTMGIQTHWNVVICSRDNTHLYIITVKEKVSDYVDTFNKVFNTTATEVKLKPIFS